jgi:hypothetical protein
MMIKVTSITIRTYRAPSPFMSNTTILISSAKESFVRQKLSSREAKIHTNT